MRALQEEQLGPFEPFAPGPRAPLTETHSPEHLDSDHQEALRLALSNLLSTDVAEFTYAQIIDGLPIMSTFFEFHTLHKIKDHPVQGHLDLCEGILDRAREFRSAFELGLLRFEPHLLQAFQNETLGSRPSHLRLIELCAVACHQIAIFLFQNEGKNHAGEYDAWITEQRRLRDSGDDKYRFYSVEPPVPFYHNAYIADDLYPHGIADLVGYWAEARIFGGVVLFDRGPSEDECREVFFHESIRSGPRTIYPLTSDQFKKLASFLTSKSDGAACPIPMHGTELNRPRYDPYHALKYCHVFRNKYESKLPAKFLWPDTFSSRDYPEIDDQMALLNYQYEAGADGRPVDEEELKALQERMNQISPSSPLWGYDPKYI